MGEKIDDLGKNNLQVKSLARLKLPGLSSGQGRGVRGGGGGRKNSTSFFRTLNVVNRLGREGAWGAGKKWLPGE